MGEKHFKILLSWEKVEIYLHKGLVCRYVYLNYWVLLIGLRHFSGINYLYGAEPMPCLYC